MSPSPAPLSFQSSPVVGQLVAIISARLPSHTREGIGLAARHDRFEAQFHRLPLGSVFQPVLAAADGATMGHEGFVRCAGDRCLSPWSLFALAAHREDPNSLIALDRLCRTLHAANYFPAADAGQRLFLSVQPGLVSAVARDHGEVYAGILRLLGIDTGRVVIQLPANLNDDDDRLRAVAESFAARGFGLAFNQLGLAPPWLSGLPLGEAPFVKIDASRLAGGADLGEQIAACRAGGLRTIVKRIGSEEEKSRALAAGPDFVQGFVFGQPALQPSAGRLHAQTE